MALIHGQVEGFSVDFSAGRFQEDWFRFGLCTSFENIDCANLVRQPAIEGVLLAPGDAGDCCEVDDSILPINNLPNRRIVSNVPPNLFTVQEPGVRVEFQVKECNRVSSS